MKEEPKIERGSETAVELVGLFSRDMERRLCPHHVESLDSVQPFISRLGSRLPLCTLLSSVSPALGLPLWVHFLHSGPEVQSHMQICPLWRKWLLNLLSVVLLSWSLFGFSALFLQLPAFYLRALLCQTILESSLLSVNMWVPVMY